LLCLLISLFKNKKTKSDLQTKQNKMNSSELIEQKLGEAQHRRNQVLTILNSVADAARPNQPKSSFSVNSNDSVLNNGNNNSHLFENKLVFEGDDRSLTNLYRAHRFQAPPPLCDVPSLRVDDLVTAFLRYRRSLHHLCYHGGGGGGRRQTSSSNGNNNNDDDSSQRMGGNSSSTLVVHQLSEVGILQQRIDKVRYECFVMMEQLRDAAVNGAISMDTTTTINDNNNNNNNSSSSSFGYTEAPEISILRQSIEEEKLKLKETLSRLTIANYVPQY
jgi:hypothetical protein